jgi:hypothetical protein
VVCGVYDCVSVYASYQVLPLRVAQSGLGETNIRPGGDDLMWEWEWEWEWGLLSTYPFSPHCGWERMRGCGIARMWDPKRRCGAVRCPARGEVGEVGCRLLRESERPRILEHAQR